MRFEFFTTVLLCAACCSAQTAEAFLKLIDRPKVPPDAQVRRVDIADDPLLREHFLIASEAGERVPGLLAKRRDATGRLPVVIVLHGTGGTKEGQRTLLDQLASRGFLAVAIDGRYHGERTRAGKGSAEYAEAMLRRYRTGQEMPFLYDTVWDLLRLIDWLQTRPDVDAARIGMIGFSKGGMETYLAAAVDPRIRVAVPCIGVQSFRWALENDRGQSRVGTFQAAVNGAAQDAGIRSIDTAFIRTFYDRVVPGLYSDFDAPRMLPLISPRPLLVINGDSDARTPQPGLLECVNAARAAYRSAGASERFEFLLQQNTGHRVTPEAMQQAIDWFVRWIPPQTVR